MNEILCLDIGGSKLIAGALTRSGQICYQKKYHWTQMGKEEVLKRLFSAFEALRERFPEYDASCPIGITIPGFADSRQGVWCSSAFMKIRDIALANLFWQRYGVKIALDNDANACALAEQKFGVWGSIPNFIYITVSNSIGGAVCLDGNVRQGNSYKAGEVGLMMMQDLLNPGQRTALEELASGRGLSRNYARLTEREDDFFVAADRLAELAKAGDLGAQRALELEGIYLGRAIAQASLVVNPGLVILGGGVTLAYDMFKAVLERELAKEMRSVPEMVPHVVVTKFGYYSALMGAGALALQQQERAGQL